MALHRFRALLLQSMRSRVEHSRMADSMSGGPLHSPCLMVHDHRHLSLHLLTLPNGSSDVFLSRA